MVDVVFVHLLYGLLGSRGIRCDRAFGSLLLPTVYASDKWTGLVWYIRTRKCVNEVYMLII